MDLSTTQWFIDLQKSSAAGSVFSPSLVGSIVASTIAVIIIVVLQAFYNIVAQKLTDWECHRTQQKHENALIHKMFWFNFFNFYSPLFYIAYFKGGFDRYPGNYVNFFGYRWQGCDGGQCTYELAIQMAVILIAKQLGFGLIEFILPKISVYFKKKSLPGAVKDFNRWEQDYILDPITDLTLFNEYLEMVIQYGFVTLFVAAFPLAPLFALVNNIIELRLDATKFLKHRQRAVARRAANIGAWEYYINLISKIAIISNAFVIALTMSTIPKMVYDWNNDTEAGYVAWSLSPYNTSCYDQSKGMTFELDGQTHETCYFYGQREVNEKFNVTATSNLDANGNPIIQAACAYTNSTDYFLVLVTRLIFVLILTYSVFLFVVLIDWIIPDRSKKLEDAIKREQHITRTIMNNANIHKIVIGLKRDGINLENIPGEEENIAMQDGKSVLRKRSSRKSKVSNSNV